MLFRYSVAPVAWTCATGTASRDSTPWGEWGGGGGESPYIQLGVGKRKG